MFGELDNSGDRRVGIEEFKQAVPKLEAGESKFTTFMQLSR